MASKFSVSYGEAQAPLVLALDVGSTGTRGGLYDATGVPVKGSKTKIPHAFTTVADGTSTIDPDAVTAEIAACVDFGTGLGRRPIDAVAIDTFASSLVGVDADGRAITPCFTYADSRCAPQVQYLKSILNEDETQQRTGTRQHTGYLPPRFLWLNQTQPDLVARVDRWLSLGEYAWLRLIGTTAAGTSTAAWTGMLNRFEGTWDAELFDLVGVGIEKVSPIAAPRQTLMPTKSIAPWPTLAEARWFAPITDGFSSSIGAGSSDSSQVVLAAATSGAMRVLVEGDIANLPRGLWCNRIDETRSILGGALNDVGRAVTWLESTFQLPDAEALRALLLGDPMPGLPIVLPFFSGERSTGWVGDSRAVFHRVNAATRPTDLYRATMEGVAWTYERMLTQLVAVVGRPTEILGTGRVSNDLPGLMQIVADTCGVPVTPILIKRSTLRGTALHALEVLAPEVVRREPTRGEALVPAPARSTYYQRRSERFQVIYDKLIAHAN